MGGLGNAVSPVWVQHVAWTTNCICTAQTAKLAMPWQRVPGARENSELFVCCSQKYRGIR
jgi:hypothetical protein